jgi:hypothetical protein
MSNLKRCSSTSVPEAPPRRQERQVKNKKIENPIAECVRFFWFFAWRSWRLGGASGTDVESVLATRANVAL